MTDLAAFKQYYKLADFLIEEATKEQLAECARLLALNVAHYQGKCGEIPLDETLAALGATELHPTKNRRHCLGTAWRYLPGCWGLP